jgi:hypothetical protein
MARTVLAGKHVLILGVSTAPGRGAALQLSREGARVTVCDVDDDATERLAAFLHKKKAEAIQAHLPEESEDWRELLQKARDFSGHYHVVINTHALTYSDAYPQEQAEADALQLNDHLIELLSGRGPLKMVTLWEANRPLDCPDYGTLWHSWLLLEPYQRYESELVDQLDARKGVMHLRAGAIADAIVQVVQFPPSACPEEIHLKYVPSTEKPTNPS